MQGGTIAFDAEARELLKLPEKDRSKISRLFAELVAANEIVQTRGINPNNMKYKRLRKKKNSKFVCSFVCGEGLLHVKFRINLSVL